MGYFDELTEIGSFTVKSGKLFISDPAYNYDTYYARTVPNAKNGTWNAYVQEADCGILRDRIARLYAVHESKSINDLGLNNEELDELGVDSGQMGIFDYDAFGNDDQFSKDYQPEFNKGFAKNTKFYDACCDITLSRKSAGVIPGGCVSGSGYGDGVYYGFTYTNEDNEVIGVEIIFIEEDDCNDQYDDDYEDNDEYDTEEE